MSVRILTGDCRVVLAALPAQSFHACVTSPPYFGLRDYGHDAQVGLEKTPDEYVATLVEVFRAVRRVLRDDGTLWLNLGDSYTSGGRATWRSGPSQNKGHDVQNGLARPRQPSGLKPKDLIGIPWRVAFALQADGWYLRQDIIWHKPNPMPESVKDRCTRSHEYIFLLAKCPRYYFDQEAIKEPAVEAGRTRRANLSASNLGRYSSETSEKNAAIRLGIRDRKAAEKRNRRSVWSVGTQPYAGAHFAAFPPALVEPCIKAGCPVGGHVLDPFGGAGTTGLVADRLQRHATLIELNPAYADLARQRIAADGGLFAGAAE